MEEQMFVKELKYRSLSKRREKEGEVNKGWNKKML